MVMGITKKEKDHFQTPVTLLKIARTMTNCTITEQRFVIARTLKAMASGV